MNQYIIGHPIITALFLIAAGLLVIRTRDWTQRFAGFMLISAGLNLSAGMSNDAAAYSLFVWIACVGVLCLVGLFEEPN
jgi:hypothetical protein